MKKGGAREGENKSDEEGGREGENKSDDATEFARGDVNCVAVLSPWRTYTLRFYNQYIILHFMQRNRVQINNCLIC